MQTNTPPLDYAARSPVRGYRWWVVFMLWFVCFFNYADRQAISSIFPKLHDEFGFDKVQLGLIGSAFMWVYAFGAPFAGYIADRVRRKNLILGGCLFWSFVTVLTGHCTKLYQFITVRAMEGLGETFYFPASMSLISDYHGKRTRSKAFAFHQSSVYAGTIAGSWAAAWLAEKYGWRSGFYLFGTAGMLLAIVLFAFLREPLRGAADAMPVPLDTAESPAEDQSAVLDYSHGTGGRATLSGLSALLKPSALLLMLTFLGANFVATIFLTWTPTFLYEKFGFKLAAAGLSGSVFIHLASAVGAPMGGILADRLSNRFIGGRMLVQALGLAIGCAFVFLIGTTRSTSTLLISMTIFGFGKGLYDSNIFASLFDVVEPHSRATAAGVMNTVGWGGGALGPLFVGYFSQHGGYGSEIENMSHAIAMTSVIYVVGVVMLLSIALVFIRRDSVQPIAEGRAN